MQWFGDPWPTADQRAPVCEYDDLRTEVPVGQHCGLCTEPVKHDDRGVWMPHASEGGSSDVRPIHLACVIHSVFPDAEIPSTTE